MFHKLLYKLLTTPYVASFRLCPPNQKVFPTLLPFLPHLTASLTLPSSPFKLLFSLILSFPHPIVYHTFKVPSGWMTLTAHFNMRCWTNASSGDGESTTVDTAMMWASFVGQVSSGLFLCCHGYSSFDDLSPFFPDNYPGMISNLTVTHVASTSVTLKWDVS